MYSIFFSSEDSCGNCQLCLCRNHFTHPFNATTSGMEHDRQETATALAWERELWDKDIRAALCQALPTEQFKTAWEKYIYIFPFPHPCLKRLAYFLEHLGMKRVHQTQSQNISNLRLTTSRPQDIIFQNKKTSY